MIECVCMYVVYVSLCVNGTQCVFEWYFYL